MMSYHKKINILCIIIEISIEYGFIFNFKYNKSRMLNWLKSKKESYLKLTSRPDSYITNNYYYSVIFNKSFLNSFANYIFIKKLLEKLDYKLYVHLNDKHLNTTQYINMIQSSLIEQLIYEEEPLRVFERILSK